MAKVISSKNCNTSKNTVPQIREYAKDKGVKGYSRLNKEELCNLVFSKPKKESKKKPKKEVEESEDEDDITLKNCNTSKNTVPEIREYAKSKGVTGYSGLKKDELCNLVFSKPKKESKKKPKKESKKKPKKEVEEEEDEDDITSENCNTSKNTVPQIKEYAKDKGVKGYSGLNKKDLCGLVFSNKKKESKKKPKKEVKEEGEKVEKEKFFIPHEIKNYTHDDLKYFMKKQELEYKKGEKRNAMIKRLLENVIPKIFEECQTESTAQLNDMARYYKIKIDEENDTNEQKCNKIYHSFLEYLPKGKEDEEKPKEEKGLKCITSSKTEIKEHQRIVVEHMLKHRGLIAVHGVGTGKTLIAVTSIACVLGQTPNMNVIILTPTSLQGNMKKEFAKYGLDLSKYPNIKFVTTTKFAQDYKKGLHNCKNTFLIVDEAHNLKTFTTEKSTTGNSYFVMQCAKKCAKVLLLTATPTPNRPNEIVNLIAMVDGTAPINFKKFDKEILNDDAAFEKYFSCKVSFYQNPPSNEFPKFQEHDVKLVMNKPFYNQYRVVEKGELKKAGAYMGMLNPKNLTAFLTGVRMASNKLESSSPKIDWVIKKVLDTNRNNPNNKVLIYSQFLDFGSGPMMARLDREGVKYANINGKLSSNKRTEIVQQYNSNEIKVLFISKAGGEGLDLKGTRHVILLEPTWNDSNAQQIKGRAIRFGSHTHLPINERFVDVWNLRLDKPDMEERDTDDRRVDKQGEPLGMEGVDTHIYELSRIKKEATDIFMQRLKEVSIEKNPKCGVEHYDHADHSEGEMEEETEDKKYSGAGDMANDQGYNGGEWAI